MLRYADQSANRLSQPLRRLYSGNLLINALSRNAQHDGELVFRQVLHHEFVFSIGAKFVHIHVALLPFVVIINLWPLYVYKVGVVRHELVKARTSVLG